MIKDILIQSFFERLLELNDPIQRKKLSNAIKNLYGFAAHKKVLSSYPIGIDIVASKRCCISCIMCHKYLVGDPWDMSFEVFEQIAEKLFPYLLYVKFASIGEHFLNKDFGKMLEVCLKYKVDVSITSNGFLVDEKWAQKLIDWNVKKIGFSFDGAKKETYEKIRRGSNYEKVLGNIRKLVEMRNIQKKKYPRIYTTFAASKSNIEELPDFVRLAKNIGIDFIRVQYMFIYNNMDRNESLYFYPDLVKECFSKARAAAKELKIKLWLPEMAKSSVCKNPTCFYPWGEVSIDPSGDIYFCCNAWEVESIGNAIKEDFKTIWNNNFYQGLRKTVNSSSQGEWYELCKGCSALQRNPENLKLFFEDDQIKEIKQNYE